MNPRSLKDAVKLFSSMVKSISRIKKTEIIICPPFLYFEKLKKISRKIFLGAQDAFWGDVGAFTGEISSEMLYNFGIRHVILGHSERRALGETDALINKKIKATLSVGLAPIVCIGEIKRDLGHGHFDVVKAQIRECLRGVSKNSISKIIIAYEPVWAISSTPGRFDATPADSLEMTIFIRRVLSDLSTPEIARETRVIYGGSVNERDVGDFLGHGGVDGVLVGRASLDPKKFVEIVKIAENLK